MPIGDGNAFGLVLRNRYLLLMALVIFLLNWVNSAGEYILSSIVKHAVDADVAAGRLAAGDEGRFIGAFFADYFQIVNIAGMVLQLFVVSRVVKHLGVPVALCILPLVALGSYTVAAIVPSLMIIRWVKTAENSVDYSLMNTVRQMLFLPATREEKYKAKQVIDSFVVRSGDVLSAGTVYLGTTFLALSVSQFAWINVALVLAWLALSVATASVPAAGGRPAGQQHVALAPQPDPVTVPAALGAVALLAIGLTGTVSPGPAPT